MVPERAHGRVSSSEGQKDVATMVLWMRAGGRVCGPGATGLTMHEGWCGWEGPSAVQDGA